MWLLFSEVVKKEAKPEKPKKELKGPAAKKLSIDPDKLGH